MRSLSKKGFINVNDKNAVLAAAQKLGISVQGKGKKSVGVNVAGKMPGKRVAFKGKRHGITSVKGVNVAGKAGNGKIPTIGFFTQSAIGGQATRQMKNWIAAGMTSDIRSVITKVTAGTGISVDTIMKNLPDATVRAKGVVTFDDVTDGAAKSKQLTVEQFLSVLTGTIVSCSAVSPIIGGIKGSGKGVDIVAKCIAQAITTDDVNTIMAAPDFCAGVIDVDTKLRAISSCRKALKSVNAQNVSQVMDICSAATTAWNGISKVPAAVLNAYGIGDASDIRTAPAAIPFDALTLRTYASVPVALRGQLDTMLTSAKKDGITVTDTVLKGCLEKIPAWGAYKNIVGGTNGITKDGNVRVSAATQSARQ